MTKNFSELSTIDKDRVLAVFPDAHDGDGFLYEFREPKRRKMKGSQITRVAPVAITRKPPNRRR